MTSRLAAAVVGLVVLLTGCASRRQPAAKPAATQPAARAAPAGVPMDVHVIDAATGQPIEGASIAVAAQGRPRLDPDYKSAGVTDARGDCTVRMDAGQANSFIVKASSPTRVPAGFVLEGADDQPLPQPVVLKLQRGTKVGGVVRNERGEPVAGAQIEVDVSSKEGDAG